jgi:hypothetical protein
MKPEKGSPRTASAETYKVIAESNGHRWFDWRGMICCLDCGYMRRLEDDNKPCKGKVGIALRHTGAAVGNAREGS